MLIPKVVVDGVYYSITIAQGIIIGFELTSAILTKIQNSQENESTAVMIGMVIAMVDQKKSVFQTELIKVLTRR